MAAPGEPAPPWDAARAALADQLWGPGFLLPGGEAEAIRLAALLPLSPATTLLLLGVDAGGVAGAIIAERGSWVNALQEDAALRARAAALLLPRGKRASLGDWDPAAPGFRTGYHHHALAIEALRRARPETLLPAIAAALRPGGQLVLLDLVQTSPPAGADAARFERWRQIDAREPPPTEARVAAALAAAGFRLHVTEDCGPRHAALVLESWGQAIRAMQGGGRPGKAAAQALLAEAEHWLLRQRLLAAGCLGLRRWHAALG